MPNLSFRVIRGTVAAAGVTQASYRADLDTFKTPFTLHLATEIDADVSDAVTATDNTLPLILHV